MNPVHVRDILNGDFVYSQNNLDWMGSQIKILTEFVQSEAFKKTEESSSLTDNTTNTTGQNSRGVNEIFCGIKKLLNARQEV